MKRALITTVYSPMGGVTAITEAAAGMLAEAGWRVRIAYYMPWSEAPELSVRLFSRGGRDSDWRVRPWEGNRDIEAYEIGVRFPEFEWRRYELNGGWKQAIADHDIHLTVSGNILPAGPVIDAGKPCLAWVATRYWPDKRDRIGNYSWARRSFDIAVNTPACLLKERRLAREADVLALSRYTATDFARSVGMAEPRVMPMGVDTDLFRPLSGAEGSAADGGDGFRLGFVGRLGDPRKNVEMLVPVLRSLRRRGLDVQLELAGGQPSAEFLREVDDLGLSRHVQVRGRVTTEELVEFYNRLDVFLLPSQQEGLGIVGLEAMACACPVVSTACGGPEDYTDHGENGFLVSFEPEEMAEHAARLLEDQELRTTMSRRSLQKVRAEFSEDVMRSVFRRAMRETYGPTL